MPRKINVMIPTPTTTPLRTIEGVLARPWSLLELPAIFFLKKAM